MAPTLRTRAQQQAQDRVVRRTLRGSRNATAVTKTKKKARDTQKKLQDTLERAYPRTLSPSPRAPQNPQACFLGLPTELRLEIYRHVFDSGLIHVHKHKGQLHEDGNSALPRFTWTPCRATNPKRPLLCANPKWSALCPESERCTFRPYSDENPLVGFAALSASCKFIRNETEGFFLRSTTISIHPQDVQQWLDHLEKKAPTHIDQLRRVTIAGPFDYRNNIDVSLEQIKQRLPNIEAVGFQGQVNKWQMTSRAPGHVPDVNGQWRSWRLAEMMQRFDQKVTVVMEGYMWCKPRRYWVNGPSENIHTVFRIARVGRDPDMSSAEPTLVARFAQRIGFGVSPSIPGWDDSDVEIESNTSKPVEYKRNAKWRHWWRAKELQHFT